MSKQVLLSPDLRKKVEARVKQCLKIAEKEYKVNLAMPEIRYDVKNTHGGLAYSHQWLIRLNLILLVENEEQFIKQTVAHEVAHLVNNKCNKPAPGKKKLMPHGAEWKKVMALFEIPAKVTHNYDCSSIDRSGKRKKVAKLKVDRVTRLLVSLNRLSEEERDRFLRYIA